MKGKKKTEEKEGHWYLVKIHCRPQSHIQYTLLTNKDTNQPTTNVFGFGEITQYLDNLRIMGNTCKLHINTGRILWLFGMCVYIQIKHYNKTPGR